MPVFTRRRLQGMLDDLSGQLSTGKAKALLEGLENKRVEQALPAEMELALLWAIGQLGHFEIEPDWWPGTRHPDAYTEVLVPGRAAAIEIAAPNDNAISGEEAMDRVALQMSCFANQVSRGLGNFLYYRFREESGYKGGTYYRHRLAPEGYRLSKLTEASLHNWITSGDCEHHRLQIIEPGLHVEIERKSRKQIRYHNFWSPMPPETHTIDSNPLYNLLKRKLGQLAGAQPDTLRIMFLADVGSTLLNRLGSGGEIDPARRRVSGREIISHFLSTHRDRIDAVTVFAPKRELTWVGRRDLLWEVSIFSRSPIAGLREGVSEIASVLPKPRFQGYQARLLFRQGLFSPRSRGWYKGLAIGGKISKELRIEVSARALLDLLAGRITAEQFRYFTGQREGDVNIFQHFLDAGRTLADVQVEPRNIDEDDDRLVLHFSDDPAARELRLKKTGDPDL